MKIFVILLKKRRPLEITEFGPKFFLKKGPKSINKANVQH